MLSILVALAGFLLPLPLLAQDSPTAVEAWVDKTQGKREVYLEEARQWKEAFDSEVRKIMQAKKLEEKQCSAQKEPEQANEVMKVQGEPSILIFVSLSMPKESLKNLYREAETQNLPLLIRGLKNNSFKETAEAVSELEIALQIDPESFEKYRIEGVPTFVKVGKKEPLYLQGNVSLEYAQQKLEESL